MVTYDPIVRLTIRHDYYGAGSEGPDMRVAPTADTLASLRELGFLFREERDGCVILGDHAGWRRTRTASELFWVTLLVHAVDEHFGLVSDVDISARHRAHCAYATNRTPEEARFTASSPTVLSHQRLPILPNALGEAVQPGDTLVFLHREEPVMGVEWPRGAAGPIASDAASSCDPGTGRVHFDLRSLPDGRYTVRSNGRIVRDGVRLTGGRVPVLMMELAFPQAATTAADPPAAALECARYEVVFAARRTVWKYTIVPRNGSGELERLSIEPAGNGSSGADGTAPRFLGPFEEMLLDGSRAYQFLSAAPVPLQRRSTVRLRLTGRRKERMTRDGVLVECLPVPARQQLALLTDQDVERLGAGEHFCSEMFVYV